MRDANRIDAILARLSTYWKQYPDLRLGQLIASSANYGVIYYAEDDQLLDLIKQTFPVKEVVVKEKVESETKVAATEAATEVKSDKVEIAEVSKPKTVKHRKKTTTEEDVDTSSDYIYMHRGSVVKRVPVDKVDEWLHLGYEKGRK